MSCTPLISIIIPSYNRASLLPFTLDSIIGQTYENWECIIVDDGSTDATLQIVKSYTQKHSRIKIYLRPEHIPKGGNACRNYGFEKSKGDYIQWFDSDDLLVPTALEEKCLAFEEDTHLVYSGFNTFSHTIDNGLVGYNCTPLNELLKDYFSGHVVLNIPSFIYRRNYVKAMRFSNELTRAQDLDFVFKCISKEGIKIKQVAKAHCLVRLHDQTITAQFSQKRIVDLRSEISVRAHIFRTAVRFGKPYVFYAAQKYFNALKKLIVVGEYELFKKELYGNPSVVFSLKRNLYTTAIVYKLTKKGMSRYNKLVNNEYQ